MKSCVIQILKRWMPPVFLAQFYFLRMFIKYQRYKPLLIKNKTLKNIYNGKRCFLLGSGSSIKTQNLKPLKNEIVFALNNFYVHPDFEEIMSGDKPKYYMTAPTHSPQNREEWMDWFSAISKAVSKNVKMIFGVNSYEDNIHSIISEAGFFQHNEIFWYFPYIDTSISAFDKKYMDVSLPIISAGTVSIYALMWAIFMGFDEIYLIGMDHNYILFKNQKEYRFYDEAIHQKNENKRFDEITETSQNTRDLIATGNIFTQYSFLRKQTSSKIINLSPISLCDVFEFGCFEDLCGTK